MGNIPQIRNYAPNMIQKRKESASLVKRVHSTANVTIKTYKYPLPHHATSDVYEMFSWDSSFIALRMVSALQVRSVG